MTGGPPVRGTKLLAWRIPPHWKTLQENNFTIPENSALLPKQRKMLNATKDVLTAAAADIRNGLLETVGVESFLSLEAERCSVILKLPAATDTKLIARAIDLENIEAWCDENNQVNVAVSPWFSTKDIDQTVLSTVKVIHVLLGIHASDAQTAKPKTLKEKLLSSVIEVMKIQKSANKE